MRPHDGIMRINFSAPLPQVADQFLACFQLPPSRLAAIEVANQTNAERNIIQVIAVDMTAVDLASPSVAHLDLAVTGGGAVTDNEMISETVLHSADMPVVVVKNARASLPCPAVVHDDELPAPPQNRSAIDFGPD